MPKSAPGRFETCYHIGLALVTWQHVENAHFKLFLRMLGVPLSGVSSVVYYSAENFESRHKMVSRMAVYFLEGRTFNKQRSEWQELDKDINHAILDVGTITNPTTGKTISSENHEPSPPFS
jgi:cytochrome b561